jgi:hypothetical protein
MLTLAAGRWDQTGGDCCPGLELLQRALGCDASLLMFAISCVIDRSVQRCCVVLSLLRLGWRWVCDFEYRRLIVGSTEPEQPVRMGGIRELDDRRDARNDCSSPAMKQHNA